MLFVVDPSIGILWRHMTLFWLTASITLLRTSKWSCVLSHPYQIDHHLLIIMSDSVSLLQECVKSIICIGKFHGQANQWEQQHHNWIHIIFHKKINITAEMIDEKGNVSLNKDHVWWNENHEIIYKHSAFHFNWAHASVCGVLTVLPNRGFGHDRPAGDIWGLLVPLVVTMGNISICIFDEAVQAMKHLAHCLRRDSALVGLLWPSFSAAS